MEQASRDLDFEGAARYRDQFEPFPALSKNNLYLISVWTTWILCLLHYQHGLACVQVMFIRQGKVLGNRSYFPKVPANTDLSKLTATFVGLFARPSKLKISLIVLLWIIKLDEKAELEALLTEQAGRKVVIQESAKGDKGKYLQLAQIKSDSST